MSRIAFLTTLLIGTFLTVSNAQYHEAVFPTESGTTLLNHLVNSFKTNTVLTYGPARDTLYKRVYRQDGVVHCVYSDWGISLPNNVDPSVHLYQGGSGINCEHNYPKSKGATQGTQAYSDMHNLYPSRADINTDRGHLPFNEVNDNSTDTWYNQNQQFSGTPSSNIDLYSELGNNAFEPKEAHKGNVARAIFYFYTMYKNQADNADNTFFPGMKYDLCQWHIQDPVDSLEWFRTQKIATYQDNKRNPFVLDCSLSVRTYCGQWLDENSCPTDVSNEEHENSWSKVNIYPNPTQDFLNIDITTIKELKNVRISIVDQFGKSVKSVYKNLSSTQNYLEMDVSNLTIGTYIITITSKEDVISKVFIKE